ncbi:hypothetical protein BH11BAC7_BH11BAC7_04040 [soil metagenome]
MKSIYLILFFLFTHAYKAQAISLQKIEVVVTDTIQPDSSQ